MLTRQNSILSLALALFAVPASAGTIVYVVNASQQFGAVDLSTGGFTQIGSGTLEGDYGLVPGPNGSLLTLTYSGNLDSINPATGATSVVGATGLTDCTTPASPCGPTAASTLGLSGGKIYATDFQNNLYSVNPLTGGATLIGATGIPAVPAVPFSSNPDGTVNVYDQSIFGAGGNLYITFDAIDLDLATFEATQTVAPDLYRIDPKTGLATLVGPTELGINAVAEVNGASYGFDDLTGQILSLDLSNGNTSFVSNFDPAAGVIAGATVDTPEPAPITMMAIGLAAVLVAKRRLGRS
jgi:hypothetical protein